LGVGASFAMVFLGSGALAVPTGGRVRLSLEGQFLGYEHVKVNSTGSSQTTWGLASPALGLGVAGGVGDNVVLGGRVSLSTTSVSTDSQSTSTSQTQVQILGIPEFVFDGEKFRPFIGVPFGYSTVSNDTGFGSGKVSTGVGLIGATIGAHCFAADSLSIDPSFSALYEGGSVSVNDQSADTSGFALIVGVALSGWFGDGDEPEKETDEESPPSTRAPSEVAASAASKVDGNPE
jgi:hypothetical protein